MSFPTFLSKKFSKNQQKQNFDVSHYDIYHQNQLLIEKVYFFTVKSQKCSTKSCYSHHFRHFCQKSFQKINKNKISTFPITIFITKINFLLKKFVFSRSNHKSARPKVVIHIISDISVQKDFKKSTKTKFRLFPLRYLSSKSTFY